MRAPSWIYSRMPPMAASLCHLPANCLRTAALLTLLCLVGRVKVKRTCVNAPCPALQVASPRRAGGTCLGPSNTRYLGPSNTRLCSCSCSLPALDPA